MAGSYISIHISYTEGLALKDCISYTYQLTMLMTTYFVVAICLVGCTQLQQDRIVRMKCDCKNSTMECSGENLKIHTEIKGR